MKTSKEFRAIISGCILNETEQTMTVYFQTEGLEGDAFQLFFVLKAKGKELYDYCRYIPVYTKAGNLDIDCMEGTRVRLRVSETENNWEIEEINYDFQYYGISFEEKQDSFYE